MESLGLGVEATLDHTLNIQAMLVQVGGERRLELALTDHDGVNRIPRSDQQLVPAASGKRGHGTAAREGAVCVTRVEILRTARRIFEGSVWVPD